MRLALEGAFDDIHLASETGARRIAGRGPLLIASAIAIAAIALLLVSFGRGLGTSDETALSAQGARFVFTPPADLRLLQFWLTGRQLAITGDGSSLIYTVGGAGFATRSIADSLAVTRLTDEGVQPVVSPDGEWVAFYRDQTLRRVRVSGGSSIEITDSAGRNPRGASWGEAGIIAFADDLGLSVVPAEGGTPELLAMPDREAGERALASPQILPGSRGVLVSVIPEDTDEEPLVAVIDLATGERDALFTGGISPRYLPTGHIVYVSGGRIQARTFDIESLVASPDPVTVSDAEIRLTTEGSEALYDVSNSGTLVYVPEERFAGDTAGSTLIWVDREGNEEALPLPPGGYQYANVSPDGSMISMTVGGRGRNIYTFDLARNNLRPLEINSYEDVISAWSHDGDEIFFTSNRDGQPMGIYARPADGTGEARRLFTNETTQWPWVATIDGAELIVLNGDDIGRLSLSEPSRLDVLVTDDDLQFKADLSPNQGWLVYQSLETGQFEIYVVPYPETGRQKLKVSIDGGDDAHWSIDGSEIFYRTYDGAMVAVPVTYTGQGIVLGEPVKLFDAPNSVYSGNNVRGYSYDVSPADGRFLMFRRSAPEDVGIVVWQNWFAEVERLTQID